MTPRDFFYTVAQMRSAQKAYFQTRSDRVLRAAIKLESIIDKEIERVREIENQQHQPEQSQDPE